MLRQAAVPIRTCRAARTHVECGQQQGRRVPTVVRPGRAAKRRFQLLGAAPFLPDRQMYQSRFRLSLDARASPNHLKSLESHSPDASHRARQIIQL